MPRELSNAERATLAVICKIIRETTAAERMYLFGSRAYGVPREDSDYDILIVVPDDVPRLADIIKKVRRALLKVETAPLDITACRLSQFEHRRDEPTLEQTVARDGILLYARDDE